MKRAPSFSRSLRSSKTIRSAALSCLVLTSLGANAAESTDPNKDVSAEPLRLLVGELSSRNALTARDYAELAQTTLNYGERQKASQKPAVTSAIQDALAAVEKGEAIDARAADWKKLRADLEKFLEKEPPPPPEQKPPPKEEEKQAEQNNQNPSPPKQETSGGAPEKADQPTATPTEQEKTPEQEPRDKSADSGKTAEDKTLFKDMKEEKKDTPADVPVPEVQTVGGQSDQKTDLRMVDPSLVPSIQKLDEIRRIDNPALLHEKMRNRAPAKAKKDW